ncbi:MAG: hypothetical protein ACI4TX_00945 [Christensenellales bacterium]
MKKVNFKMAFVKCFPLFLLSSVILFIIFMILGFIIKDAITSNIMFALSFAFLLLYIPSFILIGNLQNKDWFKKYKRCFSLKKLQKQSTQN